GAGFVARPDPDRRELYEWRADPRDPGSDAAGDVRRRTSEPATGVAGAHEVALARGGLVVPVLLGAAAERAPDSEVQDDDDQDQHEQTGEELGAVPVRGGVREEAPDPRKAGPVRGEDLGLHEEKPSAGPGEDGVVDEAVHRGGKEDPPELEEPSETE